MSSGNGRGRKQNAVDKDIWLKKPQAPAAENYSLAAGACGNGRCFAEYSSVIIFITFTMETSFSLNSKSFPVWVFINTDMPRCFSSGSVISTAVPLPMRLR